MKKTTMMMAVMAAAIIAGAADKKPVKLFLENDGSPGKVHPLTLRDHQLHPMRGFFYNESYFLIAITDQGYYGYVTFLVSNTGIESNQPGFSFTIVTPDLDRYVKDIDFRAADLKTERDRFELRLADNYLRQTAEGFELKIAAEDMGMELKFKNTVPGFVLGNGRAVFGDEGEHFFYINYPCPRPVVTGSFTLQGKTIPVSGWGYMDHSIFNSNPAEFQEVWHNFKFHSPTHTVLISSFTTPPAFEKNFGHAVLTDDKQVLCAFTDVRVTKEEVETDAESGKPYPARVRYELVGEDCSVRAVMDSSQITEKFDVLAKLDQRWYGRTVKKAIHAFIAKPWYFRSVAEVEVEFTVKGETRKVTGTAFNEIIFTN